MWRADHFDQQHWVTTRETHFVDLPPQKELGQIPTKGTDRVLTDNEVSSCPPLPTEVS